MTKPKSPLPSREFVAERLHYDPETGAFTWKDRYDLVNRYAGSPAGGLDKDGYLGIWIGNRDLKAARVAWLLMTGEWPTGTVDHKNKVRDDNRWENLRIATVREQQGNTRLHPKNTTGVRGVVRPKGRTKFVAQLKVSDGSGKKKTRCLGSFERIEDAKAAYDAAAKAHFGEFYRP